MLTKTDHGITFEYPDGTSDEDFVSQVAGRAINALSGKMQLLYRITRISALENHIEFYEGSALLLKVEKTSVDPIEAHENPPERVFTGPPVAVVTGPT